MGKRQDKGNPTDVAIFWMNVKPASELQLQTFCWEWTGSKNDKGYGHITRNQKQILSHRYAWELINGAIPEGKWVLHKCDNPSCVRPSHMFIGDHVENMRDMALKGRNPGNGNLFGERHGCAKLTEETVRSIRRLCAEGKISQRDIGKQFQVTQAAVSAINTRRVWRHIA